MSKKHSPTTASHAAVLCEELAATGQLSDSDSALLLATVQYYGLDHNAPASDWQKSFQTIADAASLQAHFSNRGRGKRQ